MTTLAGKLLPMRRGNASNHCCHRHPRERAVARLAPCPIGPTGGLTGAYPVDRGKAGSQLHVAGEADGLPLAEVTSAADSRRHHAGGGAGRPPGDPHALRTASPPAKVHADKAYDHRRCRAELPRRGIRPRIARRMIEPSARLGRHRWRIERTGAWLGGFRRLGIGYERCSERF